jgi:hypothetical protein
METLGEPKHDGGGRRAVAIALALSLLTAGAVVFTLARRGAPPSRPAPPRATPAPRSSAPPTRPTEPREPPAAGPVEAAPLPSAARLRVESDVAGASVFLDRKFLGTTPVEVSGLEPGTHRLNVSAEGHEMYGEPVELRAGANEVVVRFREVRLDERIAVSHKHGIGSCRGELVATPSGLRFESEKPGDSFEAPFTALEPLAVDYLAKSLRVRQKGGKTWNFTSDSADALLVFQKRVEAARAKLGP